MESLNQVTVSKDWLHACGRREYNADTAFEVAKYYMKGGWEFYDIIVPWQDTPWTVIEWRLAK